MMPTADLVTEAEGRVQRVLHVLSLKGCVNTLLGDSTTKGASG